MRLERRPDAEIEADRRRYASLLAWRSRLRRGLYKPKRPEVPLAERRARIEHELSEITERLKLDHAAKLLAEAEEIRAQRKARDVKARKRARKRAAAAIDGPTPTAPMQDAAVAP